MDKEAEFRHTLQSLGLGIYADHLIAEAFDSWEVLAQITEDDLTALGFRLGHRRRLQQAIAESQSARSRDSSSAKALWHHWPGPGAPHRPNFDLIPRGPLMHPKKKRKYVRHAKPDVHAPSRPPTAYVIFSNWMRDGPLRGKGHSFQEIAKLVGANWQVLEQDKKQAFHEKAKMQRAEYDAKMTEYVQTPEWREYQEYLKEFNAKHRAPRRLSATITAHRSGSVESSDSASMQNDHEDGYRVVSPYESSGNSTPRHSRTPSLHILPPLQSTSAMQSPTSVTSLPSTGGPIQLPSITNGVDEHRADMDNRGSLAMAIRTDRRLPPLFPTRRP